MKLFPSLSPLAIPLLALACTGGTGDGTPVQPSQVGSALSESLALQAQGPAFHRELAGGLFSIPNAQPTTDVTAANCQRVEELLQTSCSLLSLGDEQYCWGEATYFLANSTPRCAARLHISEELSDSIYALDLSGQPLSGPIDGCGNGLVEEQEECDDGNLEEFDGCDSTCAVEEFKGCEAVIEQYYQDAGIAFVDKSKWDGPRSHMMINAKAKALIEVNQLSCDAAVSLGVDVCNELVRQMPFVGSCEPVGGLVDNQCDIRFMVYFSDVDAANGAYTTALPGILAFSI